MVAIDWRAFGEQALLARRRLQRSQQALADAIGISRNYVSLIELGSANPTYVVVMSICWYLEIAPPQIKPNVAMNVANEPKGPSSSA